MRGLNKKLTGRADNKKELKNVTTNKLVINSLIAYVEEHKPVGDFLKMVLTNNLRGSISLNDGNTNLEKLVAYLYWNVPSKCWGSEEAYYQWIDE